MRGMHVRSPIFPIAALVLGLVAMVFVQRLAPRGLEPSAATAPVADDADDPAIWTHPTDPARSVILGTNKVAAPGGALYVFGLDGQVRQIVKPLDRPNNVDIEYGMTTP